MSKGHMPQMRRDSRSFLLYESDLLLCGIGIESPHPLQNVTGIMTEIAMVTAFTAAIYILPLLFQDITDMFHLISPQRYH